MLSFREFINEQVLYRGVGGQYDDSYTKGQDIVWVSTSKDHADMYGASGEVVKFKLRTSKLVPLDLGFRASETQVKWDEVQGRIVQEIMRMFSENKLSRDAAIRVKDKVDDMQLSGHKQVWEWMHIPKVTKLIKEIGFNAIIQREGLSAHSGDTVTYGILDQSLIRKLS